MTTLSVSQQIALLMKALGELPPEHKTPAKLDEVLQWVARLPEAARTPALLSAVSAAFNVTNHHVSTHVGISPQQRFDDLLPRSGWLAEYMDYTMNTEPPSVFHFFAGATAIGTVMSRNVFFDMGAYQIYPNLCVIIVAPSGRCRKTSACNMAVKLVRSTGVEVLADKVTPEALVDSFSEKASATGLIYAPELAVFLGRQKYNEGLVPLLTALFDCPPEWRAKTVSRGEITIHNVAISMLGCSTMDWIQTSIPRDAFGGGFMSRLLFVIQEDTDRCFPLPPPLDQVKFQKLHKRLLELTRLRGAFTLSPDGKDYFLNWYNQNKQQRAEGNKLFAGYYERKADHMFRLAMVLTLSKQNELVLTASRLEQATRILNWLERAMPDAFDEMQIQGHGAEQRQVVLLLRKNGGTLSHTELLRRVSYRLSSRQFQDITATLIAAGIVEFDTAKRVYYLTPEGWKR